MLNIHARNPIIFVGASNVDSFQNMFQNYDYDSAHSLITRSLWKTSLDVLIQLNAICQIIIWFTVGSIAMW